MDLLKGMIENRRSMVLPEKFKKPVQLMWPVIPVYSFGNVWKQFLLKSKDFIPAIFRMFISYCTIENYLVTVHVQNFPVKFQFSELFFLLPMKFILLLLPEHLSRRLFTWLLAAPILSSVWYCKTVIIIHLPGNQCHK